jgi:outer membrane lipoprotein-sorting protein
MKKIALLFLMSSTLCLTNCSDDDSKKAESASKLDGKWKLVSITAPMVSETHTIKNGSVSWQFDESENRVTVISTSDDDLNPLESGNYTYSINKVESICDESLKVGEIDFGCISIDNNTLTVSTAYVDGNAYIFKK